MSNDLMHDIRLWRIVWILYVAEVLRRTEDFECEGIQEFALGEDTVCRFNPKTCFGV